jgi:glucose/arabinose dehydrogenase
MSPTGALTAFLLALNLCTAGWGLYSLSVTPRQTRTGLALLAGAGLSYGVLATFTTRLSKLLFKRLIIDIDLLQLVNQQPAFRAGLLIVALSAVVWALGSRRVWAAVVALATLSGLTIWQWAQANTFAGSGAAPVLAAAAISLIAGSALTVRPRLALALPVISAASLVWLIIAANTPPPVPPPALAGGLPSGFHLALYAQLPDQPTALALDDRGNIYVATSKGSIFRLAPAAQDGQSIPVVFASGLGEPLGVVWHASQVYISTHTPGEHQSGRILVADAVSGQTRDLVTGLPAGAFAWHQNNNLALGPDDRLYLGIGSTSDHNPEKAAYAASIVSVNLDGSDLKVFATGLRNPYGLAFSADGQLFATDNGPDHIDSTLAYYPPDELNQITAGGNYGFPKYFGAVPPGTGTFAPILLFTARTVPTGLTAYPGGPFPAEFRGNLFVALWQHGPELGAETPPRGQRIARVILPAEGSGASIVDQDFVTGLQGPIDVKVGPAGDLFIADMLASRIYRVSFTP